MRTGLPILFLFFTVTFSCAPKQDIIPTSLPVGIADAPKPTPTPSSDESERSEPPYQGVTIDQVFPIVFEKSFSEGDEAKGHLTIPVLDYTVEVDHFRPLSLRRAGRELLKFRTRNKEGYWSILVGVAHLLGKRSTQIYVVYTGPGAVCCTNYWIIDVTKGPPREIFGSERFGSFREPMEIFDHEGDGVYELVQFDSCFRYFMEDCGTCTPEPRVTFKFDKQTSRYLPARGIMQDFARASLIREEESLEKIARALETHKDPNTKLDLHRTALDYFVQRLHLGDETKAWRLLRKYGKPSKKMLGEIKWRLATCPYYQALKKGVVARN